MAAAAAGSADPLGAVVAIEDARPASAAAMPSPVSTTRTCDALAFAAQPRCRPSRRPACAAARSRSGRRAPARPGRARPARAALAASGVEPDVELHAAPVGVELRISAPRRAPARRGRSPRPRAAGRRLRGGSARTGRRPVGRAVRSAAPPSAGSCAPRRCRGCPGAAAAARGSPASTPAACAGRATRWPAARCAAASPAASSADCAARRPPMRSTCAASRAMASPGRSAVVQAQRPDVAGALEGLERCAHAAQPPALQPGHPRRGDDRDRRAAEDQSQASFKGIPLQCAARRTSASEPHRRAHVGRSANL